MTHAGNLAAFEHLLHVHSEDSKYFLAPPRGGKNMVQMAKLLQRYCEVYMPGWPKHTL